MMSGKFRSIWGATSEDDGEMGAICVTACTSSCTEVSRKFCYSDNYLNLIFHVFAY